MNKSRLQELCQQRCWDLPRYTTTREGSDHNPRFRATVIVNDISFHADDVSKTSKEAQNKAALNAFKHLTSASPTPSLSQSSPSGQLSRLPSGLPSSGQLQKEPSCVAASSESAVIMNLHKPRDVSLPAFQVKINKAAEVASEKLDSTIADSMKSLPDIQKTHSPSGFEENDDSLNDQSATVQKLKDPEIEVMKAATDTEFLNAKGALLCKRIQVYQRKPDLVLPEGATLLPFSDDTWVAVCFKS